MRKELIKRTISSLILLPITFYCIISGSIIFNIFLITCFVLTLIEWQKMGKKNFYLIPGYIFLIFSFYSAYSLRNYSSEMIGLLIFLFITITCIATDIGGYISGKIFKGPKLTKISPKKTYSGMIGGFILSIISVIIFLKYIQINFLDIQNQFNNLLLATLFISLVSQIGDILISYFKRLSKIKDTGKIIPGHGGILDRIDGMLLVFPVLYLIVLLEII